MNLKLFCKPESRNLYTRQPWSHLAFTYAVDGLIAVRVPRDPVVLELPKTDGIAQKIDQWLVAFPADLPPMPMVSIPSLKARDCRECDGRGTDHDCPDCHCDCRACGGRGYIDQQVVVRYSGTLINAKNWLRIATLPNVHLAPKANDQCHVLFAFDGGQGIVMPMRGTEKDAAIINVECTP